jgi:Predicted nuclease of the RecB family
MDSQVIQAPTPEEVKNLLGESKCRNACLSLYTHCAVAYEGRAQSQLEAGDRFVLDKSDGTVLVHSDTNRKPRNWQPPGATVQVTDTDPLVITAVRTNPREVIRITCKRVYHTALLPIDDDASLELQGSEADLRDRLFETPGLIEDGFRPEAKEYNTPAGPVDVWGYDAEGRPVILELKRRRVGPDAVSQLRRYVESVEADVRGILVAPSNTERAERLLEEFGLESRQVAPPTEIATRDRSLAEFVAGDTENQSED